MKWLALACLFVFLAFLGLMFWCICAVASLCDREEEERHA